MQVLREVMAKYRSPNVPELPRFIGGAVGFFGYGASGWFEAVIGGSRGAAG